MSDPKSKLIVDEDWKSQAQAEKEALEATAHAAGETPADAVKPDAPSATADQLPPADLTSLVTTLATQALMLLGQVPNPLTGQAENDPPHARYFIDLIEMLETKTAGNRSAEESQLLTSVLHELRMIFVHVSSQPKATG